MFYSPLKKEKKNNKNESVRYDQSSGMTFEFTLNLVDIIKSSCLLCATTTQFLYVLKCERNFKNVKKILPTERNPINRI